jgi:hypothetical protein
MHIHAIALSSRYLQVSHDIIRHPRLNGTAKALLQWALSLPPGTRETLQTLGQKMPEGRIAVSKARRQLIDEGYVHIRRGQSPRTGMWATAILVSNVALHTPEEIAAAWAAHGDDDDGGFPGDPGDDVRPDDRTLTVGGPEEQAVGTSPKGENTRENTTLPAQRRRRRAAAVPAPEGPADDVADVAPEGAAPEGDAPEGDAPEGAEAAAAVLFRAVAVEPRLRLGVSEALELAPLAAEWLARGATEGELRCAVVEGLPDRVHSPVALLRSRLERKLPPLPAHLRLPSAPEPSRTHVCARCEAPGLAAPGICRSCAGLKPGPESFAAANAIARRGAAAIRTSLGWAAPAQQACASRY